MFNKLKKILRLVYEGSFDKLYNQVIFILKREFLQFCFRIRDMWLSTQIITCRNLQIESYHNFSAVDVSQIDVKNAEELVRMYMNHRFDLLGSGWIKNGFYNNAIGVAGYKYQALVVDDIDAKGEWLKHIVSKKDFKRTLKIYQHISSEYQPIDWQKDYKTGYRWNSKQWYRPIELAKKKGADIKVPWELSRLEHLPRLALFYKMFPEKQEEILQEYKDECLDFIAQNPVRKGVNWMCTMDIGIRTANMVLSYWLFVDFGAEFQQIFQQIFCTAIYVHCNHIWNNLEWSTKLCSNHYLANICGLLYGASFFGNRGKAKKWLAFARGKFSIEMKSQFHEEGSNFEGAIGYHRLSGEMIVYTAALITLLSQKGYCKCLLVDEKEMIQKIAKFAKVTMNPSGDFVQIGDNDSGRFFNLTPVGNLLTIHVALEKYESLKHYKTIGEDKVYFDEKVNSPMALIAAANVMRKTKEAVDKYAVEQSMIQSMIGNTFDTIKSLEYLNSTFSKIEKEKLEYSKKWEIVSDKNLKENMEYIEYSQFGICIFKSDKMFLCVNATDNGQKGNAGHAHNDKLSFELWIDGKPVCQDPGTYLYTAILEERDRFRSSQAHNAIQNKEEQNVFKSTFSMYNDTRCYLVEKTRDSIHLGVKFRDTIQERKITVCDDRLLIEDYSNYPFESGLRNGLLTNGYGKLVRKQENK